MEMFETVTRIKPGKYGVIDVDEDREVWIDDEITLGNIRDTIWSLQQIADYWEVPSLPSEPSKELKYEIALKAIRDEGDCGCDPLCYCNTKEGIKIRLDAVKDIATEALR